MATNESIPELQTFTFDDDEAEEDNDGQLIFYSGVYRWEDGSLNDEPEHPEEEEEE